MTILASFNMVIVIEFDSAMHSTDLLSSFKAWFKRRILHASNQILILDDSNKYIRQIRFKRRIILPNKIAERE